MAETAKRGRGRPRNSEINEDTHKVVQSPLSASARPTASPTGARRSRRRKAGSLGGFRNVLTVNPVDPNFFNEYSTRWVLDTEFGGHKLLQYYNQDWDFVRSDEVSVGDNYVYSQDGMDYSIVRVPAGTNVDSDKWMFLMKKYRDWYEADQMERQKLIDQQERYVNRKRDPETEEDVGDGESTKGLYGDGGTTIWGG